MAVALCSFPCRTKVGCFLVRESASCAGEFVLVVKSAKKVSQIKIRRTAKRYDVGAGHQFDMLLELYVVCVCVCVGVRAQVCMCICRWCMCVCDMPCDPNTSVLYRVILPDA